MPVRRPIVGGNWKMNTNRAAAVGLAGAIVDRCAAFAAACDVVMCPPFPYLHLVGEVIAGSSLRLGAQDVFDRPDGAFTGEVSTAMLLDLGVSHVIVGHSERRHVIGEGDELVNRKARAALEAGLEVILCVGETLEQRQAGETDAVNVGQLRRGLDGVAREQMAAVTIAYEPVWAIGTGRTATPQDAQAVHGLLRRTLRGLYDDRLAAATRIQYGGSVKAGNAGDLFARPDIDGGLIGGASLVAEEFAGIVAAAAARARSTVGEGRDS